LTTGIALIGILVLSTVDDANGDPLIETSIIAQLIAFLGLVLGVVGPPLFRAVKDTGIVREQVQNSHTVNLRDDNDDKHDRVLSKLDHIDRKLDRKIDTVREDISRLNIRSDKHEDRIDLLEQTEPSKRSST
jgi:hypothetical protein|tara:strand:- start:11644 stop:12039 length:396 start_codon:yes stop_codon:yes gene_type:complete